MNTILISLTEDGKDECRISVDLSFFTIEEINENVCMIVHKTIPEYCYAVRSNFMHLHYIANGFNFNVLN